MLRLFPCLLAVAFPSWTQSAEIRFDFNQFPLNETPSGFRSVLSGQGRPGEWKTVLDEVPRPVAPVTPGVLVATNQHVLAQLSADPTDERFPMLIYEGGTFSDFKVTTRFKIVSGITEQMAGIAFRFQDEQNYYYIRASSLGSTFRFFKVVNGERSPALGPMAEIAKGVWHELTVECKGNQIRCLLDGSELIPILTDNSFSAGKIGFWTKSDSISHFSDTKIVYTPHEPPTKMLIREILQKYPRLVGLTIYSIVKGKAEPVIIGSIDEKDLGSPGGHAEKEVITRDVTYYGKSKQTVTVTLPLHDRNGEPIAAAKVTMKSFLGQTEQNAIVRALPIIKEMEARIRSAADLLE